MFEKFVTAINFWEDLAEISRVLVKKKYIIPVFSVLEYGENALKKAAERYFEYNVLDVDEVITTAIHPSNVVFQHVEVPKVKNEKSLMNVANFKIATQFSLPPAEVIPSPLNSLKAIKNSVIPIFAVTRDRFLKNFLEKIKEVGFPEPDIVDINPLPILKLPPREIFAGSRILFSVDLDYSILYIIKDSEIIGINYIGEGFSAVIDHLTKPDDNKFDLLKKFLTSQAPPDTSLIEEASDHLSQTIGYQLRMYISNTFSSSPNTSISDEPYFDTVFVVAQSDLSTKIYVETFKRILGDEKNVLALPLRMDASPQFSYNVAGLLVRGGEILGKRKLAFKEESL
ncbi:hypothetical protein [Kosmotoga sp.]|uniref:hypothetical protein n=1 Tax=Kosmotoga sp. TaxID=1955248 RepID=UPI0024AB4212|nr:hypothetical protein [Kosmotoga sp.]MDI3523323.1 hypothetical protein [Kosmotoga sp.]MDK2953545.1 hypothetical protein [Kosmotoga sp.]